MKIDVTRLLIPISNDEIVEEICKAIREGKLKTILGIKAFMLENYPEVNKDRRDGCLITLANILAKGSIEGLTPPGEAQSMDWKIKAMRR